MGMYDLSSFPQDSEFWQLVAYCAGTGGSMLVIGSAAGVAFMGMEKVDFFWYFRKVHASVHHLLVPKSIFLLLANCVIPSISGKWFCSCWLRSWGCFIHCGSQTQYFPPNNSSSRSIYFWFVNHHGWNWMLIRLKSSGILLSNWELEMWFMDNLPQGIRNFVHKSIKIFQVRARTRRILRIICDLNRLSYKWTVWRNKENLYKHNWSNKIFPIKHWRALVLLKVVLMQIYRKELQYKENSITVQKFQRIFSYGKERGTILSKGS